MQYSINFFTCTVEPSWKVFNIMLIYFIEQILENNGNNDNNGENDNTNEDPNNGTNGG